VRRFRHRAHVDIQEALADVEPFVRLWLRAESFPGVPLYSGGLVDGWPKQVVDALTVAKEEWAHVRAALLEERKGGGAHG